MTANGIPLRNLFRNYTENISRLSRAAIDGYKYLNHYFFQYMPAAKTGTGIYRCNANTGERIERYNSTCYAINWVVQNCPTVSLCRRVISGSIKEATQGDRRKTAYGYIWKYAD